MLATRAAILALAAYLSKEAAFVLPLLGLVVLPVPWRKRALLVAPHVAALTVVIVARTLVLGGVGASGDPAVGGVGKALQLASGKLAQARGRVAVVTDHQTGSLHALARDFAAAAGGTHLVYEPFSYESVREANRRTFGQAAIPNLDFGAARMIVSFGADFLETWLHPTGHARGFAAAHPEFDPLSCREILATQRVALDCSEQLRLWPHRHGCDGFFAAAFARR